MMGMGPMSRNPVTGAPYSALQTALIQQTLQGGNQIQRQQQSKVSRDSQGRVVLPSAIREWAGLGSEAVIVGAGGRVDIWAPDRWAAKGFQSPDQLSNALSGLGL